MTRLKDDLAEWLLSSVMSWDEANGTKERLELQALASMKYDEYQRFSPGMRFVESLAIWLSQFEPQDRITAYEFVKKRLIFISSGEMTHCVMMAFPDVMAPHIIREAGLLISEPETRVVRISNSQEYKVLLRQCLFLGLSDGAHIDIFRRANLSISQEQVLTSYDLSNTKANELIEELGKSLATIVGRSFDIGNLRFKMLFLLDDFSGSGISYFRKEGKLPTFHGKIFKILRQIYAPKADDSLSLLFNPSDVRICIVLYIATAQALDSIRQSVNDFCHCHGIPETRCTVEAVYTLHDSIKVTDETDEKMINVLKQDRYFDKDIIDEHYRKGRCERPYLGFDECSLPLILSHNSPNNTIPLLWFDENARIKGLFPRSSRHRREK